MAANLYSSLDAANREIRLLELAPSADATATINSSLHVISLYSDTRPDYTALSYVWGDARITTCIKVEGIDCQVTTNLELALRHVRKPDQAVLLWADAVCINQNDMEERTRQVLIMSSIYSSAKETIAWVGEESEDSILAFQFITQWAHWIKNGGTEDFEVSDVDKNVQLAFNQKAVDATETFGRRPYWGRVWVLQELVLSKHVDFLCGQSRLPISDFRLAGNAWPIVRTRYGNAEDINTRGSQYLSLSISPMKQMLSAVQTFESAASPIVREDATAPKLSLDLLLELQGLQATDPRDKIYGLLGLLSSKPGICPSPDYTRPVEDLFCELAKDMLLTIGNMTVAHYAATKLAAKSTLKLPSWVPEWGACNTELMLEYYIPWRRQQSSNLVINSIRFTDNNRVMHCKGVIIDYVEEVYPMNIPHIDDEDESMLNRILKSKPIGGTSALQTLFRAVSIDTYILDVDEREMLPNSTEYWDQAASFLVCVNRWLTEFTEEPNSITMRDRLLSIFLEKTVQKKDRKNSDG